MNAALTAVSHNIIVESLASYISNAPQGFLLSQFANRWCKYTAFKDHLYIPAGKRHLRGPQQSNAQLSLLTKAWNSLYVF